MASKTQRLLEAPEILIQGGIDDGFSARLVQLAVSFLNELKGSARSATWSGAS